MPLSIGFICMPLLIVLYKTFVAIRFFSFACTSIGDVIYHEKLRFLDKFHNF